MIHSIRQELAKVHENNFWSVSLLGINEHLAYDIHITYIYVCSKILTLLFKISKV